MSTRDRLTVASAVAVALACSALAPLFEDLSWVWRVLGAVVVVSGTAALARALRLPRLLQPVAATLGLAAYVLLVFVGSTLSGGLVPTGASLTALGDLLGQGLLDVEEQSAPTPVTPGLALLAVLGAGGVTVVVDLVAVVLRRVAASGLPLLVLFAVPSAVLPGGLGLLPFVLGAAGWLGLLLADGSDRAARWGTPLRSGRGPAGDPSLGRVGRRIGAAALGVAVVVPALVPGLDGRLISGDGGAGSGGSRTTTTYNPFLSLAGQLRQSTSRLLTYRTDTAPDYLRLTTLDVFDERSGWSSSELSGDLQDDAVSDGIPAPDGLSAPRQSTEVEVSLVGQLDGPWLPAPAGARDVEIDGPWLWDAEAETVFSTRTSLLDVEDPYVVRSERVQPTADLLRRPQDVPAAIAEAYAVRPQLSPYVQALLDRTTAAQETTYDKVVALQRLFRETDFVYSESASVPGTNAPDALENFLRGKEGFCEQYSSAMAAMVRGLGVPARVAVGFITGSRVEEGRYQVTTRDAHAWPEVWFAGAGWVRFEPTPRRGEVDVPSYSLPPSEVPVEQTPTIEPSAAPQAPVPGASADPGAVDRGADGLTPGAGATPDQGLSPWLLLVPGALLAGATPALLAALRRRRRWREPGPLAAWATVCDDASDVGHRWRPADSPRAAAEHLLLARPLPERADAALRRVAAQAERARYARTAPDADSAALHRDTAAVREALLAAATPRERWLARLAPPSTLRAVSARLGSTGADVLDRLDAAVTAVGARLRHPVAGLRRS